MSLRYIDVGGGRRMCWPTGFLAPNATTTSNIQHAVLILDVSPSMKTHNVVASVHEWKRVVLKASGATTTNDIPATIITFARTADVRHYTRMGNVDPQSFDIRDNTTHLTPVVPHLVQTMCVLTNTNTWIVIVSDGVVHDCAAFICAFTAAVGKDMLDVQKWTVTPVRLDHDKGGIPEIRALCHIAQMSAKPDALCTITNLCDFENGVHPPAPTTSFSIENAATGQRICVVNGEMFKTTDTTQFVNVPMVAMDHTEAVQHLEQLAEQHLGRLTAAKIAGRDIDDAAEDLAQLIEQLRARSSAATDTRVRDRARTIVARLTKTERDVVQHLRALKNVNNVHAMNTAQLDAMLRSMDPTSKHARSYVRRAAAINGSVDAGGTDAVNSDIGVLRAHMAKFHIKMDSDASGLTTPDSHRRQCWLSHETSLEAFIAAMDAAIKVQKCDSCTLDMTSFYKMFGLMGIPVSHAVKEYPDAAMVYGNIHDVVFGVSMLEQSLRNAYDHSPDPTRDVIKSPYFNTMISAVIPVFDDEWNDPDVWDAYWKTTTNLGRYVTSAHLRRSMFPVSQDAAMFVMAAILHLFKTKSSIRPSMDKALSYTLRLLHQTLIRHMQHLPTHAHTLRAIQSSDGMTVAPFRSNMGYTHYMHAMAFLVCTATEPDNMTPKLVQSVFAHCMWRCMKFDDGAKDRKAILLHDLLGVTDALDRLTPVMPDDQPEPDASTISHYDNYVVWSDSDLVRQFQHHARAFFDVYRWASGRDVDTVKWHEFCDILTGPDIDFETFSVWHIAVAILCKGEAARIHKDGGSGATDAYPQPHTTVEAQAWLRTFVRDYYANNYRVRVALKADRIRRAAIDTLCTTGVHTLPLAEFHHQLCQLIPSHTNNGAADIHRMVVALVAAAAAAPHTTTDRADKLRLLVLGSAGDDNIRWNSGRIIEKYARHPDVRDVFRDDADTLAVIDNLRTLWHHVYDCTRTRNRHGYSNCVPSFFAVTGHEYAHQLSECDFTARIRAIMAKGVAEEWTVLHPAIGDAFWDDFATNTAKQDRMVWNAMHSAHPKHKHQQTEWHALVGDMV